MPPVPQRRILLVEDDPAIRRSVARFLERQGCYVRQAEDGREALRALEREAFDAALCDISMPNVDGVALWRAVSRAQPELAGRFVFVSALPLPDGLPAGARYVAKPFTLGQLWEVLAAALQ